MSEEWKKMKDVVDSIFEQTKDVRKKMNQHYDMFLGKIWNEKELTEDDSKITFNMLFSIVQAQAPLLTDNNPIPTVIPKHDYMENVALMYNNGIKYLWDTMEMQMQTMKALIYAMTKKVGIFKIYYDPQKKGGELCCDVVDPALFFIAPGYDDVWKAPFCGVREKKPLSWVRANFPKVKDLKAESSIFNEEEKKNAFKYQGAESFELDVRYVTVYEVYIRNDSYKADYDEFSEEDLKKETPYGKYLYFTKDTFLGEMPSTDKHALPPYVTVVDYVDPSGFLGIDEVDQTEGLVKELNLLYQAMVRYTHQYLNPSYEYDVSQATDKDDIQERLTKGGQIFSKRGDVSNSRMLIPVFEAQQNPMVTNLFMMLPNIIEEVSGITDVTKGEASKKQRQSASEIAMLLESSHTRIRQKVRNLEHSLKRVCYLFVKLMQQYYTEPQMIHNQGPDGEGVQYSSISNTNARARDLIAPEETVMKGKEAEGGRRKRNQLEPGEWQAYQDYKNFVDAYGDADPVYFDFEIQIDTNSTLPLDKQTLANMVIRLAQMQLVDRQAVLETLKFPNRQDIIERMDAKEQGKQKGGLVEKFMKETGTPPPQGGIPPGLE